MTSPVLIPKEPRRRRSSLKRQRLAVIVSLCLVAVLAVSFAIVHYITSRTVFPDADGTKYYIVEKNGEYVMEDSDGNTLRMTEDGNYETALGTIIMLDESTGKPTVIAAVIPVGSEKLVFSTYSGAFDILLYPMLERAQIKSIRVVNEKGDFKILRNKDDDFEIEHYEGYDYDDIMFASLVVATGYTNTYMRLDLDKVKEYGYAEYGLPDDPADAKTYFEITDMSGNTHKVVIGNKIPSGAGYYARHADREEVYILKEMEATSFNAAFSTVIFGGVEEFVAPLVITPMSSNNYFDVQDFKINTVAKITAEMLEDPSFDVDKLLTNVITFDYLPIEQRKGTYYTSIPYEGEGAYAGYAINSYKVDDCLQNLMNLEAERVVKIFSEEEKKTALFDFFLEYGIAYSMEYTHVLEREGENKNYATKTTSYQQIWISPVTEDGTYYVFNEAFLMIVEVSRAHFEYLEWKPFGWIESNTVGGSIAYLQELVFTIPTYAGIEGLAASEIRFRFDNSASIEAAKEAGDTSAIPPSDLIKIWANGEPLSNITGMRQLYETLLYSTLSGMATCTEEQQQTFRDAAVAFANGNDTQGVEPYFAFKMIYNSLPDGSGVTIERTYCFYKYGGGSQCFATLNGRGSFYMLQDRVEKIAADVGRVFTGETIIPTGKS